VKGKGLSTDGLHVTLRLDLTRHARSLPTIGWKLHKMSHIACITALDRRRLELLASRFLRDGHMGHYVSMLLAAVDAAKVVPSKRIPPDVVTMNTRLRYADRTLKTIREATVVYPEEANAAVNQVSVLSPLGRALLGMKVGQRTTVRLPYDEEHEISVLEILYQPEAEGHFTR